MTSGELPSMTGKQKTGPAAEADKIITHSKAGKRRRVDPPAIASQPEAGTFFQTVGPAAEADKIITHSKAGKQKTGPSAEELGFTLAETGEQKTGPTAEEVFTPVIERLADQVKVIDFVRDLAVHHALLEAREELARNPAGREAITKAQTELSHVSEALEEPALTPLLRTLARHGEQLDTNPELHQGPTAAALIATLLRQPADQPLDTDRLIKTVCTGFEQFAERARQAASQPIPDNPEARAGLSSFLQILLDVAIGLLTNLLVTAAFTLTSVQAAAHLAASDTVEVAGRVIDYAGHAWPSLVAVGALAVNAAAGVSIARQAWESIHPSREPRPVARPVDDQIPTAEPRIGPEPAARAHGPSRQRPAGEKPPVPRPGPRSSQMPGPAQQAPRRNGPGDIAGGRAVR